MILYNPTLADVETDNHWLPTVHLADGTDFLEFLTAHPDCVTATFTAGEKATGQGDVMAALLLAWPGRQLAEARRDRARRQILAGHTPTPGRASPPARPASTTRRSPAPRCPRHTWPDPPR